MDFLQHINTNIHTKIAHGLHVLFEHFLSSEIHSESRFLLKFYIISFLNLFKWVFWWTKYWEEEQNKKTVSVSPPSPYLVCNVVYLKDFLATQAKPGCILVWHNAFRRCTRFNALYSWSTIWFFAYLTNYILF